VRGFYTEGRAWLSEILELPSVTRQTIARARALQTAGHLANCQGDYATALDLLEESRAIAQEFRDDPALGASLHLLANTAFGRAAAAEADLATAARLHAQSLEIQTELADQQGRIRSLAALARLARIQGDTALARRRYVESLRAARESYQVLELARSLEGVAEL